MELPRLFAYYQHLDLCQNFAFVRAPFELEPLRTIVESVERRLPAGKTPLWFGSNHDHSRLATRWAGGDERKARAALFLLLTLRGTALLYQGDEIALADGDVPRDRVLDVADPPRDPERTPMPWTRSGGEWSEPWLPLGDTSRNVEDQRADPESTLNYVRALIEQRRQFHDAPYRTLPSEPGVWAYSRGETTFVVNMTGERRRHAGLRLAPWQCMLVS